MEMIRAASLLILSTLFLVGLNNQGAHAAFDGDANSPPATFGSQIRFDVDKYQLPNGLTVLLHEDHTIPLISYHTWFRVGSKHEEPGYTGIAHLFEHMMFKGAKRYGEGQFDTLLQANGATNNAFTSHDYTGYYENLPSSKLELVIDIESDRMENLMINPDNLKSEREVVKEERRYRVDNNPMGVLREAMYGTVFRVHPYRWPVIGYMKDLNNISLTKANEFYRTYYAPNNAVVVVAGDFKKSQAKKWIQTYYGAIPAQKIPEKNRPAEPDQSASRTQFLSREVETTMFLVAYKTSQAGTEEGYALDLLANILGYGNSSRLYQRLVYKSQAAASVSAYNYTLQDTGLFQAFVNLKPGVEHVGAQRAVYAEIWKLRNRLVSKNELLKAKNQVMKSYVDGLKTVHGKAEALAVNEILFSDFSRLFSDLDRYNRVTAEEIQKAAQKFLSPEKSNFIVLRPAAKGGSQ